jgi:SET family sugar efflux transporter-like MFS transporter
MYSILASVWRSPVLRLPALILGFLGAINASVFPYQSLIAIERIGLTDAQFAVVLLVASVAGVAAALVAGIVSDQQARRRQVAMVTAALAVLGPVLMWLAPSPLTLVLCHGLLLPISGSLFGQTFALARLATADRLRERDGLLAAIRSVMSATFLAMLLLWSFAFGQGLDVMAVYALAALASAVLLALIWRDWPRDGATRWSDPPSGLSLRQSLREIVVPRVLLRIAILGAIGGAPMMYMILVALIFDGIPGRGTGATALFMALVAGFEVPFMLLLSRITPRLGLQPLIAVGGAIYAAFLLLLPMLAPTPAVWLLPVLAGLGGAAILTLPITYLQNLMADRPGAGSSLFAVQKVTGDVICAGAFALGSALGGYWLAAGLGAAVTLTGAGLLLVVDRRKQG